MDPMDMDPMGYICSKEVLELNEITYLDQLLCFNTTEEQCYKVSTAQCGNFRIFLSLRFYVKSKVANLESQNVLFYHM